MSKGRDLLKLTAVIAVTFALGMTLASALNLPRLGQAQARGQSRVEVATARTPARGVTDAVPSFADVVERVNPSVVLITTNQRTRAQTLPNLPPAFRDFFRQFPQQPRLRQGSGSGFIVSRDGYILTNNHVVADADSIIVTLPDNRQFPARVIGRDPNTDVAVIRINATELPAVTFGNSDAVRIGDWVLAIGNPLGFTFTVTAGIVSAKGRALDGLRDPGAQYSIQDFIQTDAAINPGNSGGPLVDLAGNVVGVNSAIASQTGLYSGYGFAIPINLARRVMDDLITTGRVHRAILGIRIRDARPEDAAYVGLQQISGVYVESFPEDRSPARSAGIQLGDIIVAVNDTTVNHVAQLQQLVGFRRAGEVVRVTVVRREGDRRGVRRTYDVRLAAAETEAVEVADRGERGPQPGVMGGRLGLRIEAMPQSLAREAGLDEDERGVLVAEVEEGGPAWRRVFDPDRGGPELILFVNQSRVKTVEEFERALRAVPRGEVVQLRVLNLRSQTPQLRSVTIQSR